MADLLVPAKSRHRTVIAVLDQCINHVETLLRKLENEMIKRTKVELHKSTTIPANNTNDIIIIQTSRLKLNENLSKNVRKINEYRFQMENVKALLNSRRQVSLLRLYALIETWSKREDDLERSILGKTNINLEFEKIIDSLEIMKSNQQSLPITLTFYSPNIQQVPYPSIITASIQQYSELINENLKEIRDRMIELENLPRAATIEDANSNADPQNKSSNEILENPDEFYFEDDYEPLDTDRLIDDKLQNISEMMKTMSEQLQLLTDNGTSSTIVRLEKNMSSLLLTNKTKEENLKATMDNLNTELGKLSEAMAHDIKAGNKEVVRSLDAYRETITSTLKSITERNDREFYNVLESISTQVNNINSDLSNAMERFDTFNNLREQQAIRASAQQLEQSANIERDIRDIKELHKRYINDLENLFTTRNANSSEIDQKLGSLIETVEKLQTTNNALSEEIHNLGDRTQENEKLMLLEENITNFNMKTQQILQILDKLNKVNVKRKILLDSPKLPGRGYGRPALKRLRYE